MEGWQSGSSRPSRKRETVKGLEGSNPSPSAKQEVDGVFAIVVAPHKRGTGQGVRLPTTSCFMPL